MDTPCGLLAETPGVLHVSDAVALFPYDSQLLQLGVQAYAGIACRFAGQVIGHVVVMDDLKRSAVDRRSIEPLLTLVAQDATHRLVQSRLQCLVPDAASHSEIDPITGLASLARFKRERKLQIDLYADGSRADSCLSLIEVDFEHDQQMTRQSKTLEATIRVVAKSLLRYFRRHQDQIFVLDRTRFAIITDSPGEDCGAWIARRLKIVACELSRSGYPKSEFRLGASSLKEARGIDKVWMAMARQRMMIQGVDCPLAQM